MSARKKEVRFMIIRTRRPVVERGGRMLVRAANVYVWLIVV